ncbi:hypothetical protein VB636_01625, partial [Paracoccus sp. APAP_BH8]|uniref:hypothetical protein n=1 Tax=Paracoccus sp. APAP_BH8 TaxID=3110237 RepID=UPI002FD846CA
LEEAFRVIEGLGLHVLAEGQRKKAASMARALCATCAAISAFSRSVWSARAELMSSASCNTKGMKSGVQPWIGWTATPFPRLRPRW